jgi:creatinine amidohydrolase
MPKVRYEEMLPHEVVEAREKCPVAYIPIGGIEWHGEHNCLGLDTVKAHALAMRCAEVGGGVAMPALFWGENRESHLMEANGDPNGKIAEKIAGHYPLLRHARAACDWYSLDGKSQAWAVTGYELVRDQIPDAGDHAAGWETSLMMALRPELVDLGRLPEDRSLRAIGTGGARDPRDASVEYGRQGVDAVVTAIVEGVRQRLPKK